MIIARTPLRISLAGGGTDMPAFYKNQPGMAVSFAINKYIYVVVNPRFDDRLRVSYSKTEIVDNVADIQHDIIRAVLHYAKVQWGLEIVTVADIPGSGTGLGSSSSLTVGLLNCLHRMEMQKRDYACEDPSPNWLAETAFSIEENSCHKSVGKQDHYAAVLGGFNMLEFHPKKTVYTEVESRWDCENPWSRQEFSDNALLLWTGISRSSTDILAEQKEGFASGKNLEHGKDMIKLTEKLYMHLRNGNIKEAGQTMGESWEVKKKFSRHISNEWIDDWHQKAMSAGAWGGKLCGAGGGGFLFFLAPIQNHKKIVQSTGLRKIDFEISSNGSEIIYNG